MTRFEFQSTKTHSRGKSCKEISAREGFLRELSVSQLAVRLMLKGIEICDHVIKRNEKMSNVRVLVGTRKGAFILTSDGKRENWDVSGPSFGGWEMYHLRGSPADPNRIYASQSSGWFGQQMQRSDDGGKTW